MTTRKAHLPKPKRSFLVPIYGGVVFFYVKRPAYDEALVEIGSDPSDPDCLGLFTSASNNEGGMLYLLGVFSARRTTMIHEVAHLCMAILTRAGMDPRDSGGEAFCYLQDAMLEELGIDK